MSLKGATSTVPRMALKHRKPTGTIRLILWSAGRIGCALQEQMPGHVS